MVCPKCNSEKIIQLKSGRNVCQECNFVFGQKSVANITKQKENPVDLAKLGNVNAISLLLNNQLNKREIFVKIQEKDGCLQIIAEGKVVPDQQFIVNYIWNGMNKIKPKSIHTIKIYGKQVGQEFPDWTDEFKLDNSEIKTVLLESESSKVDVEHLSKGLLNVSKKESELSKVEAEPTLFEWKSSDTILIFKKTGLLIKRIGGFLSQHKKGKLFIDYKDIQNVQYSVPKIIKTGFIYFQTKKEDPKEIGTLDATSCPTAVLFIEIADFEKVKSWISENIWKEELPDPNEPIKCVKCGSIQLQANKKGFSGGKAVAGAILTGGIGLLAGFWGSNDVIITCLKCGHQWKPKQ